MVLGFECRIWCLLPAEIICRFPILWSWSWKKNKKQIAKQLRVRCPRRPLHTRPSPHPRLHAQRVRPVWDMLRYNATRWDTMGQTERLVSITQCSCPKGRTIAWVLRQETNRAYLLKEGMKFILYTLVVREPFLQIRTVSQAEKRRPLRCLNWGENFLFAGMNWYCVSKICL